MVSKFLNILIIDSHRITSYNVCYTKLLRRTKRELWKAHTKLSSVRKQARSLLALQQDVRQEKEPILMKSLAKIGLVSNDATLDRRPQGRPDPGDGSCQRGRAIQE